MGDIIRLKRFLQKNHPNIQAYDYESPRGMKIYRVYDREGIIVNYIPDYEYIEIFGLTKDEFEDLIDEEGKLKTFEFRRRRKNENES